MNQGDTKPFVPSAIRHLRETRRQILLPFMGGVLLIVVCVTGAMLLQRQLQVAIVSDVMVTVLMLCPAVICMLPVTLLFVIGAIGMNRVHDGLAKPLQKVEDFSRTLNERTRQTTDTINQQTVNTSARMGALYRFLSLFDYPTTSPDEAQEK